jgi:hypothetical protein
MPGRTAAFTFSKLWRELGVGAVIRGHAKSKRTVENFERALFTMVANRALSPYSKLYCWEQWLREEVFLPSARELDLHHLYLAMDFLEESISRTNAISLCGHRLHDPQTANSGAPPRGGPKRRGLQSPAQHPVGAD